MRPALMSQPAPALQTAATAIAKRRGTGFGGNEGALTHRRTSALNSASKGCQPAAPMTVTIAKPQSRSGDRDTTPTMIQKVLTIGVNRSQCAAATMPGSESHAKPCSVRRDFMLSAFVIALVAA